MDLFLNELSLHAQFHDLAAVHAAIGELMRARQLAQQSGRSLYTHRSFQSRPATPTLSVRAAIQSMPLERRLAILSWMNQQGPFWGEPQEHSGDDWYEHQGEMTRSGTSSVPGTAKCRRRSYACISRTRSGTMNPSMSSTSGPRSPRGERGAARACRSSLCVDCTAPGSHICSWRASS